jgi:hypothetical protein
MESLGGLPGNDRQERRRFIFTEERKDHKDQSFRPASCPSLDLYEILSRLVTCPGFSPILDKIFTL